MLLALGPASSLATEKADALAALRDAYYRFEVVGYCSLVDGPVADGFRREVARLTAIAAPDGATVDRLRGEAWQAAHAEWQNRGLGGFRGWCRKEGAAYAARFQADAGG